MSEVKNPIPEGAEEFEAPVTNGVVLESKIEDGHDWGLKDGKFDDETLRDNLQSMNAEKFFVFLNDFDLEKNQYEMSQGTVDKMIATYLDKVDEVTRVKLAKDGYVEEMESKSAFENYPALYDEYLKREMFDKTYLLNADSEDEDQVGFNDKMLNSVVSLYKDDKYVGRLEGLLDYVDQQPQTFSRGNYYKSMIDLYLAPEMSMDRPENNETRQSIKDKEIHGLAYEANSNANRLENHFKSILEQSRVDSIKLAQTIFLTRMIGIGVNSEGYADEGRNMIDDFLTKVEGLNENYLVSSLARSTKEDFDNQTNLTKKYLQKYGNIDDTIASIPSLSEDGTKNLTELYMQFIPDNFVVTTLASDSIGIYNLSGILEKVVSVQDLNNNNLKVNNPGVLPIYKSSEKKNTDELDGKERLDALFMLSLPAREEMTKDFNIDFSTLSVATQYNLFNYLKDKSRAEVHQVTELSKSFGRSFLESFLSLEQDPNMANVIFDIAKKHDHETASEIFKKYTDLIGAVDNVRNYLQENFGGKFKDDPGLEDKIVDNLLKRGKDILTLAANLEDSVDVQKYLANAKAEVLLFYNTLVILQALGEDIDINEFKDVSMGEINGLDLVSSRSEIEGEQLCNDKKTILNIFHENWQGEGLLGDVLVKDFEDLLSNPNRLKETTFYFIRSNNDILGFFRLDKEDNGSYHFASVNSRKDLAGVKLGEKLLDNVFTVAAKGKLVEAECLPTSPITSKYIGKHGFVGVNLTDFRKTEDIFKIIRDDRDNWLENSSSKLANLDYQQLLEYKSEISPNNLASVRYYTFPQGYNDFVNQMRGILNNDSNTVITAYQQEKPRQADGSYGVVIGLENLSPSSGTPEASQLEAPLTT